MRLFGVTHDEPLVIAHRGGAGDAPENSLAAFDAAITAGCDAVELDVRRTADGVLVLHHPRRRRGTPLARLTYAELIRRSRHEPPRFEDAVDLCAARVGLDVELKDEGIEAAVLDVLAQRFPGHRLLITSFHRSVIATVKTLDPTIACGLLVGLARLPVPLRREVASAQWAIDSGVDVLLPHQVLSRARAVRPQPPPGVLGAAGEARLPVIVWTVNGERRMARCLADRRIAGIITDLPEAAGALRRRLASARADSSL